MTLRIFKVLKLTRLLLDLFLNIFFPQSSNDVKLLHLLVFQGLRYKLSGKSFVLAHKNSKIYCPTVQQKFRHQTEKHNVTTGWHFSLTDVQICFLLLNIFNLNSINKYHSMGQCPSKHQDTAVKLVSSNI